MSFKWKVFITFFILTIVLVVLGFVFQETFGFLVYLFLVLPATWFSKLGLPTIARYGESIPSLPFLSVLGFAMSAVFYLIIFYLISALLEEIRDSGISKKLLVSFSIVVLLVVGYLQWKNFNNQKIIPAECRSFYVNERPDCLEYYQ